MQLLLSELVWKFIRDKTTETVETDSLTQNKFLHKKSDFCQDFIDSLEFKSALTFILKLFQLIENTRDAY